MVGMVISSWKTPGSAGGPTKFYISGMPGPGNGGKATFRCHPFQSALSGSLFFLPAPLVEVMISEGFF